MVLDSREVIMKKLILLTLILGSIFKVHADADSPLKAAFENNDTVFVSTHLGVGQNLLETYNGLPLSEFLNSIGASDATKQLVADAYLFYMVQNGTVEKMQEIIDGSTFILERTLHQNLVPANVNAINPSNGVTPAMVAAVIGDKDKLVALIANGANVGPDVMDHQGNTALHHAASYGQISTLKILLNSGLYFSAGALDVNQKNTVGETALMLAAQYGARPAIEVLVNSGADKTITNNDGHTALWYLDNGPYHSDMYLFQRNQDGSIKRDSDGYFVLSEDPVLAHQALVDMLTL